jgi:plasmid stabilization system protein ParE
MPRGDKSKYTEKQKRKAEHIEEAYETRGVSHKEAERRAWATVNRESGGGKKSGSGRGQPESNVSSRKGGRLGGERPRRVRRRRALVRQRKPQRRESAARHANLQRLSSARSSLAAGDPFPSRHYQGFTAKCRLGARRRGSVPTCMVC